MEQLPDDGSFPSIYVRFLCYSELKTGCAGTFVRDVADLVVFAFWI